MSRGRRSGAVLAAAIGLLALAPAPAAAAGASLAAGRDTVGAVSARAGAGLQGIAASTRRGAPVFKTVADLGAGVAARHASGVRPASLAPGIGANVRVSPATTSDRFSETAVAIDPNDPTGRRLTAASNFTTGGPLATYASADGGATWTTSTLVGDPSRVSFLFHPGVAYDTAGVGGNHTFFSYVGEDQQGTTELEVVRQNPDGSSSVSLVDFKGDGHQPDKPMIATDPRPGNSHVYVAYDSDSVHGLMVAESSSGGVGWATPSEVWNSGGTFGAWPAVAGDGTLYVVWDDYCGGNVHGPLSGCPTPNGQILLARFTGGGVGASSPPIVITPTTTGFGSILPNYAPECTQGCPARPVNPSPQLAIDHSGGPRDGTLYVVYGDGSDPQAGASTVPSAHRMHVFLQESKDGGTTWSSRMRIDSGNPNDAWQPSVAVDQSNGNVVVSWYDRRDDASNRLYVPYFTESLSDSGGLARFSAQLPVADVQSDPEVDCNGSGDSMQIAAANGNAHPVWTDGRSGLPAIYTSAISEATAATSTSTAGTGSSGVRPAAGTGWLGLPGGGRDIGVGADCTAWIIGQNAIAGGGQTWVWAGPARGWLPFPGGGVRVTVHAFGLPRVVNASGGIFRLQSNGVWLQAPGGGTDIASGPDQSLWLIGLDSQPGGRGVWQFNGTGWDFARGGGVRIAVGPDGLPWIVNSASQIWHLTPGGAWVQVAGGARDIGVGADGSVWILGLNPIAGGWQTWRFNGGGWDPVNGGGVAIAVGPDGMPWVVNSAGQIFERV